MDVATRVPDLVGPNEGTGWWTSLRWFGAFVLVHMAARSLLTIQLIPDAGPWLVALRWAIVVTAATGAAAPALRLTATRIAAVLVVIEVAATLPLTANHVFLELVCLTLLSLVDVRDEEEAPVGLNAFRWLAGIMFFYTGLQKVLWGFYFDGQFLAWLAGTEDRFALVFSHVIPEPEMNRLISLRDASIDIRSGRYNTVIPAGPFRVDSFLFIALSNAVYVFEMLTGLLVLMPRTRRVAAVAAIVFVIFIELGARELTFGALMINLLLLYLRGPWVRRLFPVFGLMYFYLVMNALAPSVFPLFWYSPA